MSWAIDNKGYSQRRACELVGIDPRIYRYQSKRPDDAAVRERLRNPVEASLRCRLRHRHGEPRPRGLRGGGAEGRVPRLLTALGFHPCRPRSGAAVGERFPVRETAFAEETPSAREVLADSRTMKGGGAAGVATLGAAGVEVA